MTILRGYLYKPRQLLFVFAVCYLPANGIKLVGGEGHDGEAGAADQGEIGEGGMGFDLRQGDGRWKGADGAEVAGEPLGIDAGGVGIGRADDFHEAHDGGIALATVEEYLIALVHGPQVIAGLRAANAAHGENAPADYLAPIRPEGGEFHQPEVLLCFFVRLRHLNSVAFTRCEARIRPRLKARPVFLCCIRKRLAHIVLATQPPCAAGARGSFRRALHSGRFCSGILLSKFINCIKQRKDISVGVQLVGLRPGSIGPRQCLLVHLFCIRPGCGYSIL